MAAQAQVLEWFGKVALAAQIFENDVHTLLRALEGERRRWYDYADPEELTIFYAELDEETLGGLLRRLREVDDLEVDEEVDGIFRRAKKARDRLSHGFFAKHRFGLDSPAACAAMITELQSMRAEIMEATAITAREVPRWVAFIEVLKRRTRSADDHG